MERNEIDRTVVCTQQARAGSADLYAMMPWVAKLPITKPDTRPPCEGYSYGQGRRCKSKAALLHVDLDGSLHYFCSAHLHNERLSRWHVLGGDDNPQIARVEKFFDKCTEWSEQAKADIATYNAQFDEGDS